MSNYCKFFEFYNIEKKLEKIKTTDKKYRGFSLQIFKFIADSSDTLNIVLLRVDF